MKTTCAYAFLFGRDEAESIVNELLSRLTENEHHVLLDPRFIALLGLFSDSGRALARALYNDDELRQLQREMANANEAVRDAFPHVLTTGPGQSS